LEGLIKGEGWRERGEKEQLGIERNFILSVKKWTTVIAYTGGISREGGKEKSSEEKKGTDEKPQRDSRPRDVLTGIAKPLEDGLEEKSGSRLDRTFKGPLPP